MQRYTVRILGVSKKGDLKSRFDLICAEDAKRAEERALRRFKKDFPGYSIERLETVSH